MSGISLLQILPSVLMKLWQFLKGKLQYLPCIKDRMFAFPASSHHTKPFSAKPLNLNLFSENILNLPDLPDRIFLSMNFLKNEKQLSIDFHFFWKLGTYFPINFHQW